MTDKGVSLVVTAATDYSPYKPRIAIMVEDRLGCSQWPFRFGDDTIVYGNPALITQEQKRKVAYLFRVLARYYDNPAKAEHNRLMKEVDRAESM